MRKQGEMILDRTSKKFKKCVDVKRPLGRRIMGIVGV